VVGGIRRALAPPQPHWWHISLLPRPAGPATGWLPLPDGLAVEFALDLQRGVLAVDASDGRAWALPLDGRPPADVAAAVLALLADLGADVLRDADELGAGEGTDAFDLAAAGAWWQATRRIAGTLTAFAAELPGRTSPVQLWPHHFDLALSWFSGRLVPGVDPADLEQAEEQMTFGFSTGDEGLPEPYLYVTAYPWPETLPEAPLPAPGGWHAGAWQGALVRYADLVGADDPMRRLLGVLRAAHEAGEARMS